MAEPEATRQSATATEAPILQPSLPDVSNLATSLGQVFKVGGYPLAVLFVGVVVLVSVMAYGLAKDLVIIFTTITIVLIICSVISFMLLVLIGFLRWRDDLRANTERFKLQQAAYEKLYATETESQDKFVAMLVKHATDIATTHPDWAPADFQRSMETLSNAISTFVPQMIQLRQDLKAPVHKPVAGHIYGTPQVPEELAAIESKRGSPR